MPGAPSRGAAGGGGHRDESAPQAAGAGFDVSRARFEALLGTLEGEDAGAMAHSELEAEGRELLRGIFQDHLDLRAGREARIDSVAA